MKKSQRVVLVLYCLLVAYCCTWIPWYAVHGNERIRVGYGWLWTGPPDTIISSFLTSPDLSLIVLRLLAATAIGGAAWFATGR